MTDPTLTPAETAAAVALSKVATANGFRLHELRAGMARAVVAAVRPHLFEEAADFITNSERLRSFTDDHMGDIEMAADELRRAARPTEEEN